MSEKTATIDGVEFNFVLMKVKDALEVESMILSYVVQAKGGTAVDHSMIFKIAEKVLKHCLIDGEECDIEKHFSGRLMLLHKAALEGLKANSMDFFESLKAKGIDTDSLLKKANLSS